MKHNSIITRVTIKDSLSFLQLVIVRLIYVIIPSDLVQYSLQMVLVIFNAIATASTRFWKHIDANSASSIRWNDDGPGCNFVVSMISKSMLLNKSITFNTKWKNLIFSGFVSFAIDSWRSSFKWMPSGKFNLKFWIDKYCHCDKYCHSSYIIHPVVRGR